ncbi:hypothetical protein A2415_00720 [candidate division WWE3 bacterium RIFOXYC1_FULL_39_7]|uniref:Aspartokinase n=2 Tax=Katanobacteria TaxID=422282 RepID=A0A1F4X8B9_UNCKA|nr:MAG: hypothetical protein A2415_00720 [candidate division WWE3 bacterium RIFOXYC1_FULL_39_7]OGC77333.1 MAG: hypothetical protein A2619_04835 [candidate division WWE3 bacterium RIFOXYD1_FULL_39_9]
MKILKFGGSSVGTPERIKSVIDIVNKSIKTYEGSHVVVVSAFQGVTDQLIEMAELAKKQDNKYLESFRNLKERHVAAVNDIVSEEKRVETIEKIERKFGDLENILRGTYLTMELTPKMLDYVLSFGERLSAYIISRGFEEATYLDTRTLIKTDENFGNAAVLYEDTYTNIKNYFQNRSMLQVATGFIGSTKENVTTTLGRGGSDFTAAIFGAALSASEVEIWTDVDGVMTADPKKVSDSFSLDNMTYEEAFELSHFGAKVIYPPTIQPTQEKDIPIMIKNTFHPDFSGTRISSETDAEGMIKGVTSISNISLILVQGKGMSSVSGIDARIFSVLAKNKINSVLITQGSSDHTICIAIKPEYGQVSKTAIDKEFEYELLTKKMTEVVIEENKSIIAVVGEKITKDPRIAGKIFDTIAKNNILISAIAQGSSDRNISIIIDKEDEKNALTSLHAAFFNERKMPKSGKFE